MNVENGFVDEPVPAGIDLKEEIKKLKKEKDAVILAHYYQTGEIQDLADFIGDSLALAQIAQKLENRMIVAAFISWGRPPRSFAPARRWWCPIPTRVARLPTPVPPTISPVSYRSIPGIWW